MRKFSATPRFLIALFATLSVLMVASALIELHQSRRELMDLMEQQAHTLLESVLAASDNALNANDEIRNLMQRRLLDNADFVRRLYDEKQISDTLLSRLSRTHGLHRIRVVRADGQVVFSSHPLLHERPEGDGSPQEILKPIFESEADTLLIGMRQPRYDEGVRYAIAVAAQDRSAIVVNIDADRWRAFQQEIGFGPLLRRVAQHPGVVYAALQGPEQIIAAGGNAQILEPIEDSDFLNEALNDTLVIARERVLDWGEEQVLEVVLPFFYRETLVGLFRLGVSLEPMHVINSRIIRRLVIITLVILAIGFVVFTFIFYRQSTELLQKQYRAVETYSSRVIEHVSDGIIVFNAREGVRILNHAAQEIFGVKEEESLDHPVTHLFGNSECSDFLESQAIMAQLQCERQGRKLHLLVTKSTFEDERGDVNTLLVVRDLTRQMQLEAQIQERERLSALGEMAGGLAHEIRNPLNAVGTIVQQLRTDFSPEVDGEEYDELMGIVYQEVRRINESVQNFLRMVRPEPVRAELFPLKELMQFIRQEYASMVQNKELSLRIDTEWEGEVYWDRRQMQQVLMNVVQNAIEAVKSGGWVEVSVARIGIDIVEIRVADNGTGIPEGIRNRIFNLYFTTKPKGTGIGLSLVQRIISDHGGTIEVESEEGRGTLFIIRIPQWISTPRDVETPAHQKQT